MSLDVCLIALVDTGGTAPHSAYLYDANITSNLNVMASHAGIYEALWRPEEIGVEVAAQLIPLLESGLALLKSDPARFRQYEPENKWGTYDRFVPWIERYLDACREHPRALVRASR